MMRRVMCKPAKVIAFRIAQLLRLEAMRYLNAWPRLERSIANWWSEELVRCFATKKRTQLSVISPIAPKELRIAARNSVINADMLLKFGQDMRERKIKLLGAQVPIRGGLPWHTDWRFGHTWEPSYFRNYNFYSLLREVPYDVKVPWELSRMSFVLAMFQNAAFHCEEGWIDSGCEIISDWEINNPLAYSVNWYPMEVSIRGINLTLALEMLLALGKVRPAVLSLFLRLITAHGEFLWRTIEYSDVRGNHYAANIIALLLFGLTLRGFYPKADRWLRYAVKAIPFEIESQFFPDGIHFEKAISYHRLVTELFLIGILAMERAGFAVNLTAKERIHKACSYVGAYVRPDGVVPIVGDNDDARVFSFDPVQIRDHQPLLGVSAAFFEDANLKAAAATMPVSLIWFLGSRGIVAWNSLPTVSAFEGAKYFSEGGVVVVRERSNFLWMDVGEVGLSGRGGHGHNDILSFELILQGVPVFVDPGSFVYTADPEARNLFRSTAYHNGLRIDGMEIAPMYDMWKISDNAKPFNVKVKTEGATTTICASHSGYSRLRDPVVHTRQVKFNVKTGNFVCCDHLNCAGRHCAERFLHLDPSIDVSIDGQQAFLSSGSNAWLLRWGTSSDFHIDEGWISQGYGVRQSSKVIVLTDAVNGPADLSFVIENGKNLCKSG